MNSFPDIKLRYGMGRFSDVIRADIGFTPFFRYPAYLPTFDFSLMGLMGDIRERKLLLHVTRNTSDPVLL